MNSTVSISSILSKLCQSSQRKLLFRRSSIVSIFAHSAWSFLFVLSIIALVAFNAYDVDGDGYMSEKDLFQLLKMIVGEFLNEKQVQMLTKKVMNEYTRSALLSFDEFCKV